MNAKQLDEILRLLAVAGGSLMFGFLLGSICQYKTGCRKCINRRSHGG